MRPDMSVVGRQVCCYPVSHLAASSEMQ